LIDEIGVVVTPGNAFGPSGEGFIRLSITTPDDRVEEGARRLIEWASKNK
jgi:LL-diaminopimelate aminotransferase